MTARTCYAYRVPYTGGYMRRYRATVFYTEPDTVGAIGVSAESISLDRIIEWLAQYPNATVALVSTPTGRNDDVR